MEVMLNTLYVTTAGAYVHRDGSTLKVEVEKVERLRVPIHHLESVVAFNQVLVSPGAMSLMVEHGVALTYLSYTGRLVARVDAPVSGKSGHLHRFPPAPPAMKPSPGTISERSIEESSTSRRSSMAIWTC